MTIEADLYTRLSGFAGLTALVSTRIYPLVIPQDGALPAVAYQRISAIRTSSMGEDDGIVRARFQVTVWDTTFDSIRAVAEQIRQALQRYTTSGIQAIYFLNETDLYDPETLEYGSALDFEVCYEESV